MIEDGITVSKFNLIESGSFETPASLNNDYHSTLGDFWVTESNGAPSTVNVSSPFYKAAVMYGNVNSQRYIKQNIYTAPASLLAAFDSGSFVSNAHMSYTVSAFGKAVDAMTSERAKFRIKVAVAYYQGEGISDRIEYHYYDFMPNVSTWQFVSGVFSGKDVKNPILGASYDCIKSIDLYCEYSYQPILNSVAYFDNISVNLNDDGSVMRYSYYENGLIHTASNGLSTDESILNGFSPAAIRLGSKRNNGHAPV